MAAKDAVRVGATLCAVVAAAFILKSCLNSAAESRKYRRLMDSDRVPPSGYTTEDGTKVRASEAWQLDNNIIATSPNGDIIQYINTQGDDLKLESVVITNAQGQVIIESDNPEFARYQEQYAKHVAGIGASYSKSAALRDAEQFRQQMKLMR